MEVRFGLPGPGPTADGDPVVATVGNFDGVHLGHQAVIAELRRRARAAGARSLCVVFEPHPLQVLAPERAPQLITVPDARRLRLAALGVDRLQVIEFSEAVSRLTAGEFCDRLLARHRLRGLLVGPGFAMGHRRHGTPEVLAAHGARRGFWVDELQAVEAGGERVSSTRIRAALAAGRLDEATGLLGRPFGLAGPVVRGERVATRLGFPTANLGVRPEQLLPAFGVYAVWVRWAGAGFRPAVANVGVRPHFGGGPVQVEAHCLDDPGDLYGTWLETVFVQRLRAEERFPDEAALRGQIGRDARAARALLAAAPPPEA